MHVNRQTGLDEKSFALVSKKHQLRVLERQIELAIDFDKPLVLHLRGNVLQDALQLLKDTMVRFTALPCIVRHALQSETAF